MTHIYWSNQFNSTQEVQVDRISAHGGEHRVVERGARHRDATAAEKPGRVQQAREQEAAAHPMQPPGAHAAQLQHQEEHDAERHPLGGVAVGAHLDQHLLGQLGADVELAEHARQADVDAEQRRQERAQPAVQKCDLQSSTSNPYWVSSNALSAMALSSSSSLSSNCRMLRDRKSVV